VNLMPLKRSIRKHNVGVKRSDRRGTAKRRS
jgi:hypothetical protein